MVILWVWLFLMSEVPLHEPSLLDSGAQALGSRRHGLVFEAHRRLYHSTLGFREIKKKKTMGKLQANTQTPHSKPLQGFGVWGFAWTQHPTPQHLQTLSL